jgi:hypothetical protein
MASEHRIPTEAGAPSSQEDGRRWFRFELPTLYPFATDAAGVVFLSGLGDAPMMVRVPESKEHGITPGTGAKWIVPRLLELELSAHDAGALGSSDQPVLWWWRRVTEWLGAWTGAAPAVDVPVGRRVTPLGAPEAEPGSPKMEFYGFGEFNIARSDLSEALRLAALPSELPTEYQLLVHAQIARRDHELRVAVIDAVAAAEVSCNEAIERKLIGDLQCPPGFVHSVRPRGFRPAHQMADQLGLDTGIDQADAKKLAELRNTAAHSGRAINRESADWAMQTVRRTVHALSGRAAPAT